MSIIRELTQNTISRIAAGEVIQKQSSMLKELLENSLDAGSRSIKITLKNSSFRISDDGSGIHREDFPILCKRFTTSKIKDFEDLKRLSTYGFRGEALSSISQMAPITVFSRKKEESLGYKGEFIRGELAKPLENYALERGTIIEVDLKSIRFDEDYTKCKEIAQCYAINNPDVAFQLIKNDSIEFTSKGKGDKLSIVKNILKYSKVQSECIILNLQTIGNAQLEGIISNNQYSCKKSSFVLFVNKRLVDSRELKQRVEGVYNSVTSKSSSYFVYLSVEVSPTEIDVNVHPNKSEVLFNHQARIFCEIQRIMYEKLGKSCGKVYSIQERYTEEPSKPLTHNLEWTLVPIELVKNPSEQLSSISELIEDIRPGQSQDLYSNFEYVGVIDKSKALISYKKSIYICLVPLLLKEMCYQYILNHFSALKYFRIEGLLPVKKILEDYSEEIRNEVVDLLSQKSELLEDYFSLKINDGHLQGIPMLLDGLIQPSAENIAEFLLRLTYNTNWNEEKQCLHQVSYLLSHFYSQVPDSWNSLAFHTHYSSTLFPYIKSSIVADSRSIVENESHVKLIDTDSLYKLFERC